MQSGKKVNKQQPTTAALRSALMDTFPTPDFSQPTMTGTPVTDQMLANQSGFMNAPKVPVRSVPLQAALVPPKPAMTPPVVPSATETPSMPEGNWYDNLGGKAQELGLDALEGLGNVGRGIGSGLSSLGEALTPSRDTGIVLAGGLSELGAGLLGKGGQGLGMSQINQNRANLERNEQDAIMNDPNSNESKQARDIATKLYGGVKGFKVDPNMTAAQFTKQSPVLDKLFSRQMEEERMRMARAAAAGGSKQEKEKPLTETEKMGQTFAKRMLLNNDTVSQFENKAFNKEKGGFTPSSLNWDFTREISKPQERKQYETAQSNFISALLRKESGAAIGKEEFDLVAKEYFPQPGDDKDTVAYKQKLRQLAAEGMATASRLPTETTQPQPTSSQKRTRIQKGNDILEIDESDLPAAMKEGYKKI